MANHRHRVGLTLALAVTALCGAASGAPAATLTLTPKLSDSETPTVIGHAVQFMAGAGEANVVTVTEAGGVVTIREATFGLVAPTGCQQVDPRAVTCSPTAGPLTVEVLLGDANDRATLTTSMDGVLVDGGENDDVLLGGAGDDELGGDIGNDFVSGGPGNDLLGPGRGSDVLNGGEGADRVVYTGRGVGVDVDLSVPRADGSSDPVDVLSSIEGAIGGSGKDVLRGDAGPNSIDGNIGDDQLLGGDGPDQLIGWLGRDRINAGAGDDIIDLSIVEPPPESEVPSYAVDQRSDRVICGPGRDLVVLPDVTDGLASDCELVAFDLLVLRLQSVRLTRRHLVVSVASRVRGSRQRIWLTVKRGNHTTLLGRSSPRRRTGLARIPLNRLGLELFDDRRKHKVRIGDELDPDAGVSVKVGR